jgi:hypothetical protein
MFHVDYETLAVSRQALSGHEFVPEIIEQKKIGRTQFL